jgi:hypothetical protein
LRNSIPNVGHHARREREFWKVLHQQLKSWFRSNVSFSLSTHWSELLKNISTTRSPIVPCAHSERELEIFANTNNKPCPDIKYHDEEI